VRPAWRKSTYSGSQNGDCVEAAPLTTAVGVRDSKDPGVGALRIGPDAWAELVGRLKGV